MTSSRWDRRVVVRYTLLQLPALAGVGLLLFAAHRWLGLPASAAWILAGLWAAKDAALYPFVWRAYDTRMAEPGAPLVGREGTAEEPLDPCGYVRLGGELWRAELADPSGPVPRGTRVRVREVQGLTLRVEPVEEVRSR